MALGGGVDVNVDVGVGVDVGVDVDVVEDVAVGVLTTTTNSGGCAPVRLE